MSTVPNTACEGFLSKQGLKIKNWKRRYFRLDDKGTLSYFDKALSTKPIKSLSVNGATVQKTNEKGKLFCFKLTTPNRVLFMTAENENDVKNWITNISKFNCTIGPEVIDKKGTLFSSINAAGKSTSISVTDVAQWTVNDVANWLEKVLLEAEDETKEQYKESIIKNNVNGEMLLTLTEKELRDELSIANYGYRKRIASEIQNLKELRVFDERVYFVYQKISRKFDVFGTDPKEWFVLSEQLSKKELLKESYFTLDIAKIKQLENNINSIDSKAIQAPSRGVLESQSTTVSEAPRLVSGQQTEYENEPEMTDNVSVEDVFASNFKTIRVKLVITEINASEANKKLRNFVSPIMYNLPALRREFGIFHSALIVGPWYLEWTNSSLCIPRHIGSSMALLSADVSHISTVDEPITSIIDKLTDVISEWNSHFEYKNINVNDKPGYGNCQDFIEALMAKLGINPKFEGTPLGEYLLDMKKKGTCEIFFRPNPELSAKFNLTQNQYSFYSHIELDQFVNSLETKCPRLQVEYQKEWILLKSFDRAFWLRHMRNPTIERYKPLYIVDEYGMDKLRCSFDDPQSTKSYVNL